MQRRNIRRIVNSGPAKFVTSLADEVKRADIEVYSQTQLSQITSSTSMGILVNKGMYYWAYKLER
jgi:hypothetical protein